MSSLKKYRRVKYLGKGSYGAAILVELRSNPTQKFVIKEIVIGHLGEAEQKAAKSEAEVLHQMSHSNITMYIESFVENSKLYIVMEHADGGDLTGAIQRKKTSGQRWTEEEVMRIFVQVCLALKHVHAQSILHRDLKSQNIFLTAKGIVKLGDFGIAKVLDDTGDQARTQIGTPYYLSPEICESKPYGKKSDIWSLGIVLFELLTFEMPFQASSLPALVHRICTTEPPYSKVEQGNYSRTMLDLLQCMLKKSHEKRPLTEDLVRLDFVKVHISKLLSFTLKAGSGGAQAAAEGSSSSSSSSSSSYPQQSPAAAAAAAAAAIDPDEAERNIERARQLQRERDMDIERDRSRARAAQEQSSEAPGGAAGNNREDYRNKMGKFYEERSGRSRSGRDDDRKYDANNDDRGPPRDAKYYADQQYDQRAPPRGGVSNDPRQQIDRHSSVPYIEGGGGGGPRGNHLVGGNNVGPAIVRDRSAPVLPSNGNVGGRDDSREYAVAVAGNGNGNGAGNGYQMSPAQDRRTGAPMSRQPDFETAASREYWNNRMAAQAFKAKHEALERGGGGGGGTAATAANNNNTSAAPSGGVGGGMVVQMGGPGAGRGGDRGYPTNIKDRNGVGGGGGGGANVLGLDDPEARVAQLKAHREKEREKQIAEQQRQLEEARAQQREERRRLDAKLEVQRQAPVAFEIDFSDIVSGGGGGGGPPSASAAAHAKGGRRRNEQRNANANANPNYHESDSNDRGGGGSGGAAAVDEFEETRNMFNDNSNNSRNRNNRSGADREEDRGDSVTPKRNGGGVHRYGAGGGGGGAVAGGESKAVAIPSSSSSSSRAADRAYDADRDRDRDRAVRGEDPPLTFPPIVSSGGAVAAAGPRGARRGDAVITTSAAAAPVAVAVAVALSADALQGMLPKQRRGWGSPLDVGRIRASATGGGGGGSGSERSVDDRDRDAGKKPYGGAGGGGVGGSRSQYTGAGGNDESDGDFEEFDSGLDMLGKDGDDDEQEAAEKDNKGAGPRKYPGGRPSIEDQEVLRKVEEKREKDRLAREQAKEVFRKLREQRSKQQAAKVITTSSAVAAAAPRKVGSNAALSEAGGGGSVAAVRGGGGGGSVINERLKDVMSSVAKAQESVNNAVASAGVRRGSGGANAVSVEVLTPSRKSTRENKLGGSDDSDRGEGYVPSAGPRRERIPSTSSDTTDGGVNRGEEKVSVSADGQRRVPPPVSYTQLEGIDEGEVAEELMHTLDDWLIHAQENVTIRRQQQRRKGGGTYDDDDGAAADEIDESETLRRKYNDRNPFPSEEKDGSGFARGDDRQAKGYRGGGGGVRSVSHGNDYGDADEVDEEPGAATENVRGDDAELAGMQCMLAKELIALGLDDER